MQRTKSLSKKVEYNSASSFVVILDSTTSLQLSIQRLHCSSRCSFSTCNRSLVATELLLQGLISESRLDKGVGICSSMSASKRSLVFKSILNLNTLKIDRLKYVASYMKYVVAYMLCHKYIYQLNDLRYFLSVASCQTPISHLVTIYCSFKNRNKSIDLA